MLVVAHACDSDASDVATAKLLQCFFGSPKRFFFAVLQFNSVFSMNFLKLQGVIFFLATDEILCANVISSSHSHTQHHQRTKSKDYRFFPEYLLAVLVAFQTMHRIRDWWARRKEKKQIEAKEGTVRANHIHTHTYTHHNTQVSTHSCCHFILTFLSLTARWWHNTLTLSQRQKKTFILFIRYLHSLLLPLFPFSLLLFFSFAAFSPFS